jgi:uncharacterized protein
MATEFVTRAAVVTDHGSRYLQQLCKHWSHSLAVTFDAARGEVIFPRDSRGADYPADARVLFEDGSGTLNVSIIASVPEQRDHLKGVVARHVDRFAFREAPLGFDWQDEATVPV